MATLETSPEANCDRWTGRMTKPLIGARATALPKNQHSLFLGLGLAVNFHKSNFSVSSQKIGLVPPWHNTLHSSPKSERKCRIEDLFFFHQMSFAGKNNNVKWTDKHVWIFLCMLGVSVWHWKRRVLIYDFGRELLYWFLGGYNFLQHKEVFKYYISVFGVGWGSESKFWHCWRFGEGWGV